MSRMDRLMLVVELMERKSSSIVDESQDCVTIMQNVSGLYDKLAQDEHKYSFLHSEISTNHQMLSGFRTLSEKLMLLDANLSTNDIYASTMSWENLKNEYFYMLKNPNSTTTNTLIYDNSMQLPFQARRTSLKLSVPDIYSPLGAHILPMAHTSSPALPHKSSIADLKLKPIKCRPAQAYKKKSQYRLSRIYTLNPVVDTSFELVSPERQVSKASQVSEAFSAPHHESHNTFSTIPTTFDEDHDTSDMNVTIELDKNLDEFQIPEHISPDRASMSSMLSLSPPLEFDNFDSFLRRSRVNLQSSPPRLKRSSSHDSIFHDSKFKFHNPAENIIVKNDVVRPTVESIYCQESAKESSSRLLAQMIQKVDLQPTAKTPVKQPTFIGMSSPLEPTLSHATSSPPRRNSVGKVLATSFLSLMTPTPSRPVEAKVNTPTPSPVASSRIPATKALAAAPVIKTSEAQLRRLPLQPISFNGAHSKLQIDKHSAVISHGLSAAIRRPIMTRVSRNSLSEALSSSIK